jgi:hypothetical protein
MLINGVEVLPGLSLFEQVKMAPAIFSKQDKKPIDHSVPSIIATERSAEVRDVLENILMNVRSEEYRRARELAEGLAIVLLHKGLEGDAVDSFIAKWEEMRALNMKGVEQQNISKNMKCWQEWFAHIS